MVMVCDSITMLVQNSILFLQLVESLVDSAMSSLSKYQQTWMHMFAEKLVCNKIYEMSWKNIRFKKIYWVLECILKIGLVTIRLRGIKGQLYGAPGLRQMKWPPFIIWSIFVSWMSVWCLNWHNFQEKVSIGFQTKYWFRHTNSWCFRHTKLGKKSVEKKWKKPSCILRETWFRNMNWHNAWVPKEEPKP